MTTREDRALALAREAWRSGLPSDDEVERSAERIGRRMRSKSRPRSMRRPAMALAFAVVLGGALAYAASGGLSDLFGSSPKGAEPAQLHGALRAGEGLLPPPPQLGAAPGAAESKSAAESTNGQDEPQGASADKLEGASADKLESASKAAPNAPSKHASPSPASSWRAVDEALDARDDAKAKQALEGLAKSDDATTRAKARLGLAQLARGRGDCTEARRIAFEVAAMRGVELSVIKHAQAIVLECR